MFDFSRKRQYEFGTVAVDDDRDIEVHRLKKESRHGLYSEGLKLVRDIILVLTVFILLGVFVAQPVVVEGTSMLPELHDGERLLVNKLVYYKIGSVSWGHIERGDIVVFWYPKEPDKSYVKRVIGLPGETVEVRNGVVYINDEEMREPYLSSEHNQALGSFQRKKVDEHYYFVMGDNRDNSSDSRYWGLVPEKYVYGKAFFRYWKPSNIGFIEKGHYELNETDKNDTRAAGKTEE
ncbi:MAG TPA: signal peptidase I [Pyrinomonadaceae bacterium]|jgi:signal peptidase I